MEEAAGDGRPTLRGDALLNRFFAFQCILPKELNALRLNDALSKGFSWAKKSVLYAARQSSSYGHPSPAARAVLLYAHRCSALSHGRVSISGASACCAERWIPFHGGSFEEKKIR